MSASIVRRTGWASGAHRDASEAQPHLVHLVCTPGRRMICRRQAKATSAKRRRRGIASGITSCYEAVLLGLMIAGFLVRPQEAVAALAHVSALAPSVLRLALLTSGPTGALVAQAETAASAYRMLFPRSVSTQAIESGRHGCCAEEEEGPRPQADGWVGDDLRITPRAGLVSATSVAAFPYLYRLYHRLRVWP